MSALAAFASGLLFGIGLLVSGMADPAKVQAFLDVTGRFDPSLAVVMASALTIAFVAYAIAKRRSSTFIGCAFDVPPPRALDRRLVGGAIVFGLGWGLAGICPGPALVLLGAGRTQGLVFVLAMLAGMAAFEILERRGRANVVAVASDA